MSAMIEEDIKRWTAWRKAALVLDLIQRKTTVAEASRTVELPPSEIEEGKRGMESTLPAVPAIRRGRTAGLGAAGGVWRGDAGASCPKQLQSLLGARTSSD